MRGDAGGASPGHSKPIVAAIPGCCARIALKGPSVQAKLEELEARQAGLAKELAALKEEPVRPHPNLAALYRRKS
jgi:hypothetical protein